MTPFANADDLALYLQTTFTTAQRNSANLLLAIVSDEIRSVTGQVVDRVTDDEVEIDATRERELVLPQRPADEPTQVLLNGAPVADWTFKRDTLHRRGGWYARDTTTGAPLPVIVTYSHGWTTPPSVLGRVSLQAAARAFRNPQGLASWSTGSESERFRIPADGTQAEVDLSKSEIADVRRALGVPRRRTLWLNP